MKRTIGLLAALLALSFATALADCKRGEALFKQGVEERKNPEKELEYYRKALAECPTLAKAQNNIGNVHEWRGEWRKALDAYNRAIRIDPKYALAYFGVADVYFDLQDYGRAIEFYDKGLKLKPGDAESANRLRAAKAKLASGSSLVTAEEIRRKIERKRGIGANIPPRVVVRILFEFDSAEVKPESFPQLDEMAKYLRGAKKRFALEGHTDSRGTAEYNLDLSRRRANAVLAKLKATFHVDEARIEGRGCGERRLAYPECGAEKCHALNRRCELVLSATPSE